MSKRTTTLGQLAELVGGRVEGDPATAIHGGGRAQRSRRPARSRSSIMPDRREAAGWRRRRRPWCCRKRLMAQLLRRRSRLAGVRSSSPTCTRPSRRSSATSARRARASPSASAACDRQPVGPLGQRRQHSSRRDDRRRLPDRRRHDDSAWRSCHGRLHDRPRRDDRPGRGAVREHDRRRPLDHSRRRR